MNFILNYVSGGDFADDQWDKVDGEDCDNAPAW